jgi:prolyl-tRNA editing enzyme YbaK/EbsC (Cys-tRNA(Pro) deacylase)
MMNLEERIRKIMEERGIPIECTKHAPVYTISAAALALGVKESQTVKSLVLKTKEEEFLVLILPGDKKLDWKLLGQQLKTKKLEFAKPEEVLKLIGCEVGCVPPFGHLTDLPIHMDKELLKKDVLYFNPGVHNKSFKVRGWNLRKLCNPKII